MSPYGTISCVFLLFLFIEVRSQICQRTNKNNNYVTKTYSYISREKQCADCPTEEVVKRRKEWVPFVQNFSECCPGYEKKHRDKPASIENCVRVCKDCCKNGYYRGNQCICHESYERYPPESNECVAKCDPEYQRVKGNCQAFCENCDIDRCISPNECSCNEGWVKNDQDVCIPTCNPSCGPGICVDLNKCSCGEGYELRRDINPQCVASCRNCQGECINGKCVCPKYQIAKYLTRDNKECYCDDDCDLKCYKTICILDRVNSTPKKSINIANNDGTTGSRVNVKVDVIRNQKSKSEARDFKPTQTNDDWKQICLQIYIAFTVIMSLIVCGLIVRQLRKK